MLLCTLLDLALAQVLTDAKQPVPDWLGGGRGYGGYY